jgi:hypothetical protein
METVKAMVRAMVAAALHLAARRQQAGAGWLTTRKHKKHKQFS